MDIVQSGMTPASSGIGGLKTSIMDIVQIGKYTILDTIAASKTTNVYRAVDPTTNRVVFLKVLNIPQGISALDRRSLIDHFYGEARSAGGLSHPNIVILYEIGEDAGRHYIAMEYLEGLSVRKLLDRDGCLPLSQAVEIARCVCAALDYAHRRGIIHRDVKPDNIIVLEDGPVKLTDFGIARIEGDIRRTQIGIVLGSPAYMSPEQIKGLPVDARTDIFSLGVCLYEMISGRKPFDAPTATAVMHCIVKEPPQPLEDIPEALRNILWKALEKEAIHRYSSAAEMLADLRALEISSTALSRSSLRATPSPDGDGEAIESTLQPLSPSPVAVENLRHALQERNAPRRRFSPLSPIIALLVIAATATGTYLYARRDFPHQPPPAPPPVSVPPVENYARPLPASNARVSLLADFESNASGWEPAFDQSATGRGDLSLEYGMASRGKGWLRVGGIRFYGRGRMRAGVYFNPDNNDWHLLGPIVRVDIFLPASAPAGLQARLGIRDTLKTWHWMPTSATLRRGRWTAVGWKVDAPTLSDVSRLAILLEGTNLYYRGAFGIDALRVIRD